MSTEQGKNRRGCFFYGCLGVVILTVILALGLMMTLRYLSNRFLALTDTKPMPLPKVEFTSVEGESAQQRLKAFGEALKKGKVEEPLVLSEREINGMIATLPELKALRDKIYVSIQSKLVKGQVSIPLASLNLPSNFLLPSFKDRYLNGEATFKVSLEGGVLIVTLDSMQVNGKPIPEEVLAGLRQQNLAKEVYKDPNSAETMRSLDSIEFGDGAVTVKGKSK